MTSPWVCKRSLGPIHYHQNWFHGKDLETSSKLGHEWLQTVCKWVRWSRNYSSQSSKDTYKAWLRTVYKFHNELTHMQSMQLYCPIGIGSKYQPTPVGSLGCFPWGKPAATTTQPMVHAACFHNPLQDLEQHACRCQCVWLHMGVHWQWHPQTVCTEIWLWEKILCCNGDQTCVSCVPVPHTTTWATSPSKLSNWWWLYSSMSKLPSVQFCLCVCFEKLYYLHTPANFRLPQRRYCQTHSNSYDLPLLQDTILTESFLSQNSSRVALRGCSSTLTGLFPVQTAAHPAILKVRFCRSVSHSCLCFHITSVLYFTKHQPSGIGATVAECMAQL